MSSKYDTEAVHIFRSFLLLYAVRFIEDLFSETEGLFSERIREKFLPGNHQAQLWFGLDWGGWEDTENRKLK